MCHHYTWQDQETNIPRCLALHQEPAMPYAHKQNLDHSSGLMHHSAKFETPPNGVDFLWSCEGLWRGLSFVFSMSDGNLTILS